MPQVEEADVQQPNHAIRVRITAEGEIQSSHTVPHKSLVIPALPAEYRKLITRRYKTANYCVHDLVLHYRDQIPYRVWADAIGTVIVRQVGATDEATFEQQQIAQGGLLALGDNLYRLQAVGMTNQTKALQMFRIKAREQAKVEAETIKQAAEIASAAVIANARLMKIEAERYLEDVKRQNLAVPLDFANAGTPLRRIGDRWAVGFTCRLRILRWTYGEASWEAPVNMQRKWKTYLIWVPVTADGSYAITSMRHDQSCPCHPHMNTAGACISLGDAPSKLTYRTIGRLIEGVPRAFDTINLASLYNDYSSWIDAWGGYAPTDLRRAMESNNPGRRVQELADRQLAEREQPEVSAEDEVFHVNTGTLTVEEANRPEPPQPPEPPDEDFDFDVEERNGR